MFATLSRNAIVSDIYCFSFFPSLSQMLIYVRNVCSRVLWYNIFFLQSRLITLLVDPDMMHQFPSIVNQKGQNKQTM